jgi:hypothetical protein
VFYFLGLIVISGNIRYRNFLEPFIVLLASVAVVGVYDRSRQRHRAALAPGATVPELARTGA